eukprot:SM000095S24991  [mRNA]  locus=s95:301410:306935:+ [translate_table: standard]
MMLSVFLPDDFKPASIDGGKPGRLVRSAGSDKVSVEFPTAAAAADGGSAAGVVAFEGRHEQCKELEGILFFDGAGFTLHRVHRAVKGLRVVRNAEKGGRRGTATAAGLPPASSAGGGGGGGLVDVEAAELAAEDGGAGSAGVDEAEDGGASPYVEAAEEVVNTGEDRPLQRLLVAGKEKRHQRPKDSAARATSSGLRAAPGGGGGGSSTTATADRSARAAAHANGQRPKAGKAAAPVAVASALDPAKRARTSIAEQIDIRTSAEAVRERRCQVVAEVAIRGSMAATIRAAQTLGLPACCWQYLWGGSPEPGQQQAPPFTGCVKLASALLPCTPDPNIAVTSGICVAKASTASVRAIPQPVLCQRRNIILLEVIVAPVAACLLPHGFFHCGSLNVTHTCGSCGYPHGCCPVCCYFSWQPILVLVAAKNVQLQSQPCVAHLQLLHLLRMPLGSKLQCSLTAGVPSPCFSQKLRTNFARQLTLSRSKKNTGNAVTCENPLPDCRVGLTKTVQLMLSSRWSDNGIRDSSLAGRPTARTLKKDLARAQAK